MTVPGCRLGALGTVPGVPCGPGAPERGGKAQFWLKSQHHPPHGRSSAFVTTPETAKPTSSPLAPPAGFGSPRSRARAPVWQRPHPLPSPHAAPGFWWVFFFLCSKSFPDSHSLACSSSRRRRRIPGEAKSCQFGAIPAFRSGERRMEQIWARTPWHRPSVRGMTGFSQPATARQPSPRPDLTRHADRQSFDVKGSKIHTEIKKKERNSPQEPQRGPCT